MVRVRPASVAAVAPRAMVVEPTVTLLLVNELLPILVRVLLAPDIVLLVSVAAALFLVASEVLSTLLRPTSVLVTLCGLPLVSCE